MNRRLLLWLKRNAVAIQAATGILTILFALAALMGVKMQIDAAAQLQREQSARDIYREYLNLGIARPEFARPDYCAIIGTPQEAAYESYVDYMLYTAEQAIEADPDWVPVFDRNIGQHGAYICAVSDWQDFGPDTRRLIDRFRNRQCQTVRRCSDI